MLSVSSSWESPRILLFGSGLDREATIVRDAEKTIRESLMAQLSNESQRAARGVRRRARRSKLDGGFDAPRAELAVVAERGEENRRHTPVAFDADAVIRGEIAKAVRNEPVLVQLHGAHNVGAVPEHEVRSRVDHRAPELDHVTAILAHVDLPREGQRLGAIALGAAVERDNDDVVVLREKPHLLRGQRRLVELIR